MHHTLVYIGSAIIVIWGIGHLAAIKSVIAGFSSVSSDNRRVITMEWILVATGTADIALT